MKKLLLSLLVAAVGFSASALQNKDLVGKIACVLPWGNLCQQTLYDQQSAGLIIEENGQLYIRNFMTKGNMPITISGNNIVIRNNATTSNGTQFIRCDAVGTSYVEYPYTYYYYGYRTISDNYTLSMDASLNGDYYFTIANKGFRFGKNSAGKPNHFNGMEIYVLTHNATATEYDASGNATYTYPIFYKREGNTITIKNFMGIGANFKNFPSSSSPSKSVHWVTGTVDANGNITIPRTNSGAVVGFGTTDQAYTTISGIYAYWYEQRGKPLPSNYPNYFQGKNSGAITGKIEGDGTPSHSKDGADMWVKCGGDLETYENETITIYYAENYRTYNSTVDLYAEKTVITLKDAGKTKVTHDAKLTIGSRSFDKENYKVSGVVEAANTNLKYADRYEIYAVPGKFTSINDEGFDPHADLGHSQAFLIASEPVVAAQADGKSLNYSFNATFPRVDNGNYNPDYTEDYTLFVKTHYTAESGLKPTFHALTAIDIPTGVEDINKAEEVSIKAGYGEIVIAGTDANAEVYTLSGVKVYDGTDRNIEVANGIYVVRVAGKVAKVVVR